MKTTVCANTHEFFDLTGLTVKPKKTYYQVYFCPNENNLEHVEPVDDDSYASLEAAVEHAKSCIDETLAGYDNTDYRDRAIIVYDDMVVLQFLVDSDHYPDHLEDDALTVIDAAENGTAWMNIEIYTIKKQYE